MVEARDAVALPSRADFIHVDAEGVEVAHRLLGVVHVDVDGASERPVVLALTN